eukprot:m51a1_g10135 putative nadp-dependent alcohol dehydrogenase (387) ;mRNA; f:27484-29241
MSATTALAVHNNTNGPAASCCSCSGAAPQEASLAIPETMRALVFQEKGRVEVVTKPVPLPGPCEALMKVTCTTICGTDVHILKGEYTVPKGRTLGHEPVGVIVAVGSAVSTVRVGGRYVVAAITPCGHCCTCQEGHGAQCGGSAYGGWKFGNTIDGCQAEYVIVPDADYNCCPIPDDITDEQAVMSSDVMSTGFSGVEAAHVRIGDTVCVYAQGPIGLCATAAARLSGATSIIAVASNPKRLEISREYGADHFVNYRTSDPVAEIRRITGGRGVDVAVEAFGSQTTFGNCLRSIKAGGCLSSLGVYSSDICLPVGDIACGLADQSILMTLCPGGKERMRRLLEVIRSGRVDVAKLATHRFKLENIVEAYKLFGAQADGVLKVIITP